MGAFQVALEVKDPPAIAGQTQKMPVQSLDWEDPLEEEMATHSSIPAWRIPWTKEPDGATVHRVAKNQTELK